MLFIATICYTLFCDLVVSIYMFVDVLVCRHDLLLCLGGFLYLVRLVLRLCYVLCGAFVGLGGSLFCFRVFTCWFVALVVFVLCLLF